jgi:hypothetical protein
VPIALFYLANSIEPKVHEQNVHNWRFNESKIRQPIKRGFCIPTWSKNLQVNRRFTRNRLLAAHIKEQKREGKDEKSEGQEIGPHG